MGVRITVTVPMLLSDCTKGRSAFELEADTLQGALQLLVAEYPLLKVHLYNEHGEVRKHVLIYYNNDNIAWLDKLDIPLAAGDKLRVLQAVSGG
ncbi:molybdopterin synthase subunit MoaD [Paenibacillus taihuensis]|uniref:Molybdopterin synthase subunit MoaD n=1 Tax=Paenibacillus taihuensis TaxID=1156355 RepID=A0A3D9SBR5_9BACL|nr:MoaD/ThiS family protein [Paenibacillus taihuensis]REE91331.1 molybdopterin synthase subunit MoaD [Paenibacillus taihuensis]